MKCYFIHFILVMWYNYLVRGILKEDYLTILGIIFTGEMCHELDQSERIREYQYPMRCIFND